MTVRFIERTVMPKRHRNNGKVGSDREAVEEFGGKGDFGIPARDNVARAKEGEIEGRPAGSAPGYSGDAGDRTTGVGSMGGPPGKDSGGDVDTDVIGLDGWGGLAAKAPGREEITPANTSDGSSDTFASGPHAAGRNTIKPGTHGSAPNPHGDSVDHSGLDSSAVNPNAAGAVNPNRGAEPGAEDEITADEAAGDLDQGAEV
jgi:hypothetical protein